MPTAESKTKKAVKELLHELQILPFKSALAAIRKGDSIHGYYQMPSSTGYGEAGIGDFLLCVGGHYMELETKGDGDQSKIQKLHQEVVEAAGATYHVVKTDEQFEEIRAMLTVSFKHWQRTVAFQKEIKRGMH